MEATQRIAVEDFPGLRIIGGKRNDFFKEFESGVRGRTLVIAGFDPAIHLSSKMMDTRVKPAYDDRVC